MAFSSLNRLNRLGAVKATALAISTVASQAAMAQSIPTSNLSGLCVIPTILKYVVGIVALGALLVWTISHMNSKNELSDLTLKIAVPCVIAGMVGYLITSFGLSVSCSGIS